MSLSKSSPPSSHALPSEQRDDLIKPESYESRNIQLSPKNGRLRKDSGNYPDKHH